MVQRKSNKRSRGEVDLTPQRQSAHLGLLDTRGTSAPRRRKSFTDGLDEDLNDEIRDLRCLEDLARLRRRKTDPPAVATRPLGWVDPLELFDEDNTMDLDAMLQSLEPKTYRNRVDGKNCAFDWTEARQRLLDTVNHGKFIYVQRRTTEVILEGTAIDMEKVPFLLMMESPEEDPKKVRENCPTHYYTKIQPSHFDPEDYIPTSLESLYDLGAAWARLTCAGQPLKAFVLASRIRPKIHAQPNEALHTPQRHTTPPAPASTPNMSISSSPVSTFGGFSTNAFGVTPTPFSTPNQNSTSPMQPPVSTFGGFSTNAFGVTPTPFSTPNQNITSPMQPPVSTFGGFSTNAFGGGGSGNSDPAAHGSVKGSSSFGFLESSSSNPTVANKILAELSLVLWDRPSLQETITTWSSGMRLVYTLPQTHVTTVRKIVLDNDRGSTGEAVCQALERVWRGRNVAVQKALAWREACPLHSDTLNEALNREIKKLMRQEQKDCPEWQSLTESIPDLQDKVQAAVEERTALKEGQLEVLRYAQQLLKNGEVLSRSQWYIVKHYPKKDSSLPFRADLKVPGLGDPDLCIPEPYVFRNPLLAEGGSTVI